MQPEEFLPLMFLVGMLGGVFVIYLAMRQRSEQLERVHRERMALIERGQVPLPEPVRSGPPGAGSQSRALSIGIIVVGLGLALMTIISVAGGSPEAGVGVGGAITILGAAFIVRSIVIKPEVPPPSASSTQPARPLPPPDDPAGRI